MSETKSELLARIVKGTAGRRINVGYNSVTHLHIVYCNMSGGESVIIGEFETNQEAIEWKADLKQE
jgi:hypothetical protein